MTSMEFNPFAEMSPEQKQELVRRTSKVVLHAAEKQRRGLFDKMTAANAKKIEALMQEKPIFYKNEKHAPREILLDEEVANTLPDDFFENPTFWIESQPNIRRGYDDKMSLPTGEAIEELWSNPYDISRVKHIVLPTEKGESHIVSKRMDRDSADEIVLARKAYEAGIPTPRVMGEVVDRGNLYAWFEDVRGINYDAFLHKSSFRNIDVNVSPFANNEKVFVDEMESNVLARGLPAEVKEELISLFKESQGTRNKFELGYAFGRALDLINSQEIGRGAEFLEYLNASRPYLTSDSAVINKAARAYGFRDLDDLIEQLDVLPGPDEHGMPDAKGIAFFNKIHEQTRRFSHELWIVKKAMEDVVVEYYCGYNPKKKKRELISLCREKDIEHKDFNNRNFVIEWDFEKDLPRKGEGGEAKMCIVDWEPQK